MFTKKSSMRARSISRILMPIFVLFILMQSISAAEMASSQFGSGSIPILGYRIIKDYPHDTSAFTQGLAYENGIFYEGTGQYGRSTLRLVSLDTGRILKQTSLPETLFGEGIAIWKDKLVQLTWQSGLGLVYDKKNLTKIVEFHYQTEGWGITSDGKRLIMSDGTEMLHFLDGETFKEQGRLRVMANGVPVKGLNELEYIEGKIYSNVWPTNWIVIISPDTGKVTGCINLHGILRKSDGQVGHEVDVLNGIAYDEANGRLFVTGKLWPKIFEIKILITS